ncbi:MAG TPA: flagellar assembly protein FliW [Deltaproteobacteria bacterium]|nr:flagellar assembly protein FliW [Deltaproteobacteria bacterium]HQH99645.1 flagellar assembly protein FliW [Deltaproteobacteria bacterium]HQJ07720.1 flagellar assembly protein FliW [Deltaproteobacteria bacterium]
MEIKTTRFGNITVQDEKVICFPKGILGFSQNKRFILFPHTEGSPFYWLQSMDDGSVAFVVMNPQLVKPDYKITVEESVLSEIKAEESSELDVLCIVTIPHNQPDKMTINLLGPIILNADKRYAMQVVCPEENYSHRHPIISDKG